VPPEELQRPSALALGGDWLGAQALVPGLRPPPELELERRELERRELERRELEHREQERREQERRERERRERERRERERREREHRERAPRGRRLNSKAQVSLHPRRAAPAERHLPAA